MSSEDAVAAASGPILNGDQDEFHAEDDTLPSPPQIAADGLAATLPRPPSPVLDVAPPIAAERLPSGVDEELAALRGVDEELSQQLVQAEEQMAEQQALRVSIAARIEELHREAVECQKRHQETRATSASMKDDMKQWSGAEDLYFEWLSRLNEADDARKKADSLQSDIDAVPTNVLKAKHRTHDALSLVRRHLNRYIVSSVCTQLSSFGAAELRLTSNAILDANIPTLVDGATKREKVLQEACSDADYRAEESMRLESSHETIAEQCLTEAVDFDTTKQDQLHKLEDAFRDERAALLRVKARLEAEAKEIEFHVKRGTNARSSTKMTSADIRLHDKVATQQDELKVQLQSFESLRSEKLQLEREAEASLQRLIKAREDQTRLKAHSRSKLDVIRRFREQLDEERADWIQARKEMHELILQQQAKVRASIVEAALHDSHIRD